jgi:DNA-directed RNA polymerase subunit E'
MFKLITLQDTIRIPPETFGKPLEKVGREQVKQKYEGIVDEELGYVIAVTGIQVSPIGKIIPGDGATFHKVTFSLLAFYPIIQEIVEGDVVEIADFGAFVRIGPVDDYISYDEKQGVLLGKETKRKLTTGDQVRVRITAVSLGRIGSSGKIGVTARQPFLGKLDWLKMDQAPKATPEKKIAERPEKAA